GNGSQPVSERLAVTANRVYWLTQDGHVVSLARDASPATPVTQVRSMAHAPAAFGGIAPGIVAGDSALTWSELTPGGGTTLYSIRRGGGGDYDSIRITAYTTADTLTSLTKGPAGTIIALDATPGGVVALGLVPQADGRYTGQQLSVGPNVTAVAADNSALYWAQSSSGTYGISTRTVVPKGSDPPTFGTT